MNTLPSNFLTVITAWACVVILIIYRIWQMPRYSYEDLQKIEDKRKAPLEKQRWYWIPSPTLFISLLVSFTMIFFVFQMKRHPMEALGFFRDATQMLLWLRDSSTTHFFIMTWSPVWVCLAVLSFFYILVTTLTLLSYELLYKFAPNYLEYKFRSNLGKFSSRFTKEWEKTRPLVKESKPYHIAFILLLGISYFLLLSENKITANLGIFLTLFTLGAIFFYIFKSKRKVSDKDYRAEVIKRFSATKLGANARLSIWRQALKTWLIFPIVIFLLTPVFDFYIFDEKGMIFNSWRERSAVSWENIRGLSIEFKEDTAIHSNEAKKNEKVEPSLDVTVDTSEKNFDVSDGGSFSLDPTLATELMDLFQSKNIAISCKRNEKGENQLKLFLDSPKADSNPLYIDLLNRFFQKCISK